jgi:hypothetical protein
MGSFYTLCSITNETIVDGQEMVIQFMLPAKRGSSDSWGYIFDSFLKSIKKEGLEAAMTNWERSTSTWGNELGSKGMEVSNDGAVADWIPFGPSIRGYYDDYGNIKPADDEETQKRIKLLEGIFCGIPFESIMDIATDDRWYTYGLKGDSDRSNDMWKLEGVNDKLPGFILDICKALSVTYFHAGAYDTMSDESFTAEAGDADVYEKKWKKEYIKEVKNGIKNIKKTFDKGQGKNKSFPDDLNRELYKARITIFDRMKRADSLILITSCLREGSDLEWIMEQCVFTSSMSAMCIKYKSSQYGSQHDNWGGWEKIRKATSLSIEKSRINRGFYEVEDED